jgi:hypothetical protein
MDFPNLPGKHNYQKRCNLERAADELEYYRQKVGAFPGVRELQNEIENATPETAGEIFKKAWHLCREMENKLTK